MKVSIKKTGGGQITLHVKPVHIELLNAVLDDYERLKPPGASANLLCLQAIISYREVLRERERVLREAGAPELVRLNGDHGGENDG